MPCIARQNANVDDNHLVDDHHLSVPMSPAVNARAGNSPSRTPTYPAQFRQPEPAVKRSPFQGSLDRLNAEVMRVVQRLPQ